MIDANGNATAFKYDALGREIERRNAPGDVWSFAYDSRDNMVLTTDAIFLRARLRKTGGPDHREDL